MQKETDKDWVWLKCPCCQAELPFHLDSAPAVSHMIECIRTAQLEAHPEVADEQLPFPEGDG